MRFNKKNKRKLANLKRKLANDVKIDVPVTGKDKVEKYTDEEVWQMSRCFPAMRRNSETSYNKSVMGLQLIKMGIEEVGMNPVIPTLKYSYVEKGKPVDHYRKMVRVNKNGGKEAVDAYVKTTWQTIDELKAKQVESPTS